MNNNLDDSWNIDLFDSNTFTTDTNYLQNNNDDFDWNFDNSFTNIFDNFSTTEWTIENISQQYNYLYYQLKPLMFLANQILDHEIFQQFQNKLDLCDANINYLQNYLTSSGSNCQYSIMDGSELYYEPVENVQEYLYEPIVHSTEQSNNPSHYDLNSSLPVEYVDFNNNSLKDSVEINQNNKNDNNNNNNNYNIFTVNAQSVFELNSNESFKSLEETNNPMKCVQNCLIDGHTNSEHSQFDNNPDSSSDLKKKRRKKVYNKKLTENSEKRLWYRCGWEGCSFGSYYNGVVKRHSFKRHCGEMRIAQSESDSMRRFKCDWPGCDVSLVAYHKLVEHKRRHTGEKPFGCKWKACQYSTGRLYSLIIHERVHKAEHLE